MKIMPNDLILDTHTYKMELYFPGLSWVSGQVIKAKVLGLLDSYDIGAFWTCPFGSDSWFLTYHLKATGRIITHEQMFDNCITPICDRAMWIDCIDLGEREDLLAPDQPLPEWLKNLPEIIKKDWKWFLAGVIGILVLLIVFPHSYKRGK